MSDTIEWLAYLAITAAIIFAAEYEPRRYDFQRVGPAFPTLGYKGEE